MMNSYNVWVIERRTGDLTKRYVSANSAEDAVFIVNFNEVSKSVDAKGDTVSFVHRVEAAE